MICIPSSHCTDVLTESLISYSRSHKVSHARSCAVLKLLTLFSCLHSTSGLHASTTCFVFNFSLHPSYSCFHNRSQILAATTPVFVIPQHLPHKSPTPTLIFMLSKRFIYLRSFTASYVSMLSYNVICSGSQGIFVFSFSNILHTSTNIYLCMTCHKHCHTSTTFLEFALYSATYLLYC